MNMPTGDPVEFNQIYQSNDEVPALGTVSHTSPRNNAATGASAAGVRALGTQLVAFYFRVPVKSFFRTRVELVGALLLLL